MRAVVVEEPGGPEVLRLKEWPDPEAGPGQLVVDVDFCGVNFMDTGTRVGFGMAGAMPLVPGVEGAGRVTAVGEGVSRFAIGDRVAWAYVYGSYAERIAVPADRVVPIPDDIPSDIAAATMMQGLTAHHFVTESAPLSEGETALVHSAAGGVGRMVTQLLKLRGVRVIGLVSREEKVPLAKAVGADEVLVSSGGDFVARVKDLTDGEGVHAVFDGGGASTFWPSTEVLRRVGTLVYYGPLIDDIPEVRMVDLPKSIKVTYAVFADHIHTGELLLQHSADLFDMIRKGDLHVEVTASYPLGEAEQAHLDIESRRTSGKLLLDPRR
ncbi:MULTISPECIES: quinone oxidoreductase family protein [unclassified Streptomyces]|uniref:quinone oxidoreductase family protein n=1 Tax=unclassified Streptomyces TaxID=2593676 RepID=UPI0004C6092A|nr:MULTISPECIES: quinone oxidoreductase [unclassified Streptomyces]KOV73927.1 alcohol dehydrogenase [Streptomyces sp. NRRL WC-3723]